MRSVEIEVAPEQAGHTLAAVVRAALAARGETVTWSRARELVGTGRVELDGEIVTDDAARVKAAAKLAIHPEREKRTSGLLPEDDLVHVDADVVVVRKPAGVITVPFADGDRDTLIDRVRARLLRIEKRTQKPRDLVVGAVQRLDKDTTGLLVFARNVTAKRALEEQLRVHSVLRRYLAIAHGRVQPARIESFLLQDRGDGLRGSWGTRFGQEGPPPPDAKRAVTHVRPLEELRGATLAECRLETGRQHQIRIHLSERRHPLAGEDVYIRGFAGPRIAAGRPMLHATELGFVHPRSGRTLQWQDPPPRDFRDLHARLRA